MEFAVDCGNELGCRGLCEEELRKAKTFMDKLPAYAEASKTLRMNSAKGAMRDAVLQLLLGVVTVGYGVMHRKERFNFLTFVGMLFVLMGLIALVRAFALQRALKDQPPFPQ
jgi:hypothetical protein